MRGPAVAALAAAAVSGMAAAQTLSWSLARLPGGRPSAGLVYDWARQRLVAFGGGAAAQVGAATWELIDGVWSLRATAVAPSPRAAHAIAYDTDRRRTLLFGGMGAAGAPLGDTWTWDGVTWTPHAVPGPPARFSSAAAHDMRSRFTVLFGGANGTAFSLSDQWHWDGTAWQQALPATRPSARFDHAMTYDVTSANVVMFGGAVFGSGATGETWTFDGLDWTRRTPASAPPARSQAALAFDVVRQNVVLFGGRSASAALADTWIWDGQRWTRSTGTPSPPARSLHALGYDRALDRVVMTGAAAADGVADETWAWNGTAWAPLGPPALPARRGAAIARDPGGGLVLFGGSHDLDLGDTWIWHGAGWQARQLTNSPPARRDHALATDPVRQRVVLFAGRSGTPGSNLGDTWEWDGSIWRSFVPPSSPVSRHGHALAFDPVQQRVLLFGGRDPTLLADTWDWNGVTWTQRILATRPAARVEHALASDTARARVVLFGGLGAAALSDTWEWDGNAWTERPLTTAPAARSAHTLVADPSRQRLLLFGGIAGTTSFADLWAFDGTGWTPVASSGPTARSGHAMGWDLLRDQGVLVGSETLAGGTWLLGSAPSAAVTPFGDGCASASWAPQLAAGVPFLGNDGFTIDCVGGPPSAACVFALAADTLLLQLPGGCAYYPRQAGLLLATTSAAGFASVTLPVPFAPALLGAVAHAQACAQGLGGSTPIVCTRPLRCTFGG